MLVYFHLAFIAVLRDCKNKDLQRMVCDAQHKLSTNCTLGWPRGNGTYFLLSLKMKLQPDYVLDEWSRNQNMETDSESDISSLGTQGLL